MFTKTSLSLIRQTKEGIQTMKERQQLVIHDTIIVKIKEWHLNIIYSYIGDKMIPI